VVDRPPTNIGRASTLGRTRAGSSMTTRTAPASRGRSGMVTQPRTNRAPGMGARGQTARAGGGFARAGGVSRAGAMRRPSGGGITRGGSGTRPSMGSSRSGSFSRPSFGMSRGGSGFGRPGGGGFGGARSVPTARGR
jgi:hypothetical protein